MTNQPHILDVDFSRTQGRFRPLHGVNNGPLNWGGLTDLSPYHVELSPPFTRLHDPHWPNPDVVDINAVFPDFGADPDNPGSYMFDRTDEYIAAIVNLRSQIIYRLGHGIEHTRRKYHTQPPADYEKWAAVCTGIIRHYNEGWAGGHQFGIQHWEIWNEPDLLAGPLSPVSPTWAGTWEDYFRLYTVTAKAIKTHFPALKVGGPAMTGGGIASGFLAAFLRHCCEQAAPLDFCSWHHYTADPREVFTLAATVRRLLDEHGFNRTLSVLDEWNYIPPGMDWGVVFNPAFPYEQRRISREIAGPSGAAFDVAVLLGLQDCPVDIATYYLADALPYFSMFDVYGVPQKAFYAFRAFRWLLDTPQRVQVSGDKASGDEYLAVGAGLSDDQRAATVLMSNLKDPSEPVEITIHKVPWSTGTRCEMYVLDDEYDLVPVKTEWLTGHTFTLRYRLPAASVLVLKLAPAEM